MNSDRENNLSAWLGEQEEKHNIVLYQCNQFLTLWTQRCIRQANNILIVVLASKDPSLSLIEEELEPIAVRTQKYLIFLHREDDKPRNTVHWLNARSWCHHHVRFSPGILSMEGASRLV
jgi:lysophospholipid hydrolase